jgi:hypothetical protein
MSIAAIYFLTFMGLLMAWSNKSILAGFFLLLFPFVIFVVMGPFLDFLVKWMNRRRLKFVHRMSVEFKNSLQSSEVPEHRMLALCLKNEKEAFGYLNDEQLLFIHRWRDGDRSPEVMRAVNTFVEEQIRGIPCDIRVNRNSDLSRRLGNLYSQWLNIHKSSAIPAMEKLPVILALSALSDIMMGVKMKISFRKVWMPLNPA